MVTRLYGEWQPSAARPKCCSGIRDTPKTVGHRGGQTATAIAEASGRRRSSTLTAHRWCYRGTDTRAPESTRLQMQLVAHPRRQPATETPQQIADRYVQERADLDPAVAVELGRNPDDWRLPDLLQTGLQNRLILLAGPWLSLRRSIWTGWTTRCSFGVRSC